MAPNKVTAASALAAVSGAAILNAYSSKGQNKRSSQSLHEHRLPPEWHSPGVLVRWNPEYSGIDQVKAPVFVLTSHTSTRPSNHANTPPRDSPVPVNPPRFPTGRGLAGDVQVCECSVGFGGAASHSLWLGACSPRCLPAPLRRCLGAVGPVCYCHPLLHITSSCTSPAPCAGNAKI